MQICPGNSMKKYTGRYYVLGKEKTFLQYNMRIFDFYIKPGPNVYIGPMLMCK